MTLQLSATKNKHLVPHTAELLLCPVNRELHGECLVKVRS